jgi:uncharacterized protein YbjT (DUF2867 family)
MTKVALRSVLVFGASGHIAGPMCVWLQRLAPGIRLRFATSSKEKQSLLERQYPGAEVVLASYLDSAELAQAVQDMDGVFVITPHFIDEIRAMGLLAKALAHEGRVQRVLRIVGFPPETRISHVPKALRDVGTGVAIQHHLARDVLDVSGLPVTYLNIGASMMDNFLRTAPLIQDTGRLVWPRRKVPYIDPRDIGEAAARLMLDPDPAHRFQVHTVNNGADNLRAVEVAQLMSEIFGHDVIHDGGRESFLESHGDRYARRFGRADAAQYMWDNFEYEASIEVVWALSDTLERLLGRKPKTLRSWLEEHRAHFIRT